MDRMMSGCGVQVVFFFIAVGLSDAALIPSKYVEERGVPVGYEGIGTIEKADSAGKRIFVVGDVHGCYRQLAELLKTMDVLHNASDPMQGLKDKHILILAGDFTRKGPDTEKVLQFVSRVRHVYVVRGNQDGKYIKKNPDSVWNTWIERQPYVMWVPEYVTYVVHAGMLPGKKAHEQDKWVVTHMRNIVQTDKGLEPKEKRNTGGRPWAEVWTEREKNDHVVFGHDAGRGLQRFKLATGIDTGCVKGRQLTAVELPVTEGSTFFSVKCTKKCK